MTDIFRVHPDHPGLKVIGEAEGTRDVGGPEIAGQAVLDVVGECQRLLFVLERDGGQHRSKDLLLGDAHLVVGGGEERRRHVAAAARAVELGTARGNLGAFRPADGDIFEHLLLMYRMDERTNDGLRIERMPDLDAARLFGDQRGELLVNAFLHQQPRRRGAAFAVQRIDHEDGGIGGTLEIGIGEDDHRVLAAEFEMHALQRLGTLAHDHRAGAAFADKADRLDQRMLGQRLAGILAEAVDEVPDAFRQAGFLGDLDQQASR